MDFYRPLLINNQRRITLASIEVTDDEKHSGDFCSQWDDRRPSSNMLIFNWINIYQVTLCLPGHREQ